MDYENLKKNKKGWITGGVILLIAIVSLFAWNNYNAHRLDGSYKGTVTFLFWKEKVDMKFSRDKTFTSTTTLEDGRKSKERGTYEVSGDKLTLNFKGKDSLYGKLKDNRKKITITSGDKNVEDILWKGVTLRKDQ
jgi:predicted negative regulator of RcsB-dependent stress response